MVPGGRWSRGVPSREHVEARRDERGRIWRGERIVAAHAVCNNKRGIALWVPFHSAGTKPKGQIVAEREVRVLVKDWRSRA